MIEVSLQFVWFSGLGWGLTGVMSLAILLLLIERDMKP